jgi:hypothetical protein
MSRARKQPARARVAAAEAHKPKAARTGRLAGFNSAGKRYKHLTIPRHLHEALPDEGTEYEVTGGEGGRIVARPAAAG